MINQRYRFHGHASLKYVFSKGKMARGKQMSIKYIDNNRRHYSRVAIIVSKKVFKHAVDRNRVRRRLYEILRQRINQFTKTVDLAVIIYLPTVLDMTSEQINNEIDGLLAKLGLTK